MRKKYLLLLIFIMLFVSFGFLFTSQLMVLAADTTDIREYKLNLPIGDLKELSAPEVTTFERDGETVEIIRIPWIAEYINALYKFFIVFGSIAAVIIIMIAGVGYIIAGANPQMIDRSKKMIVAAIFGLILLLGSYTVLSILNPRLINLPTIDVERTKRLDLQIGEVMCEDLLDNEEYSGKIKIVNYDKSTKCGTEFKVEALESNTGLMFPKKCISGFCADSEKKCVPAGDSYVCTRALFYGKVTYKEGRYVENIAVISINGSSTSTLYKIKVGDGKNDYKIPYTQNLANKIKQSGLVALEIEVNDTGQERSETFGTVSGSGQAVFNLIGVEGTIDDDYYVGRALDENPLYKYNGIWFDFCDNFPYGAWPCKTIGPGGVGCSELALDEDRWLFATGVGLFSGDMINNKDGIRIDIDTRFFREDSDIKCPVSFSSYQVNGAPCKKSEFTQMSTNGELKCIKSGVNNYIWSDAKLDSYCANQGAGYWPCKTGTCVYSNEDSEDCLTDPCWGICKKISEIIKEPGDSCSNDIDCGYDKDGKKLLCNKDNICTYGEWGDVCGKSTECANNFYCDVFTPETADYVCRQVNSGLLNGCDIGFTGSPCSSGLDCIEPQTWNDGTNSYGCNNDENEKIDIYMCADPTQPICYCDPSKTDEKTYENSDCPSTYPHCVDGPGNDNFCTSGQAGMPCYEWFHCSSGHYCDENVNICKKLYE